MMYIVYIVDHIHHLLNEPKKSKFACNSDQREYVSVIIIIWRKILINRDKENI